jgi:hypothetical protein
MSDQRVSVYSSHAEMKAVSLRYIYKTKGDRLSTIVIRLL